MPDNPDERQIRVITEYPNPQHIIQFINFVRFTHVGTDIIMDLGVLNDQQLVQALNREFMEIPEIIGWVSERFGMSITTLAQLKRNVDEIWGKVQKSGLIPKDLE